jgi:hypothetical protein
MICWCENMIRILPSNMPTSTSWDFVRSVRTARTGATHFVVYICRCARAYWAIVMPLRGMGRTILIPVVALRSTTGYSHAATNVANSGHVVARHGSRPPFHINSYPSIDETAVHIIPANVQLDAKSPHFSIE